MGLRYFLLLLSLSTVACSDSSTQPAPPAQTQVEQTRQTPEDNKAVPDNRFASDYNILIFGNSHIIQLASLLKTLIHAYDESIEVEFAESGSGFLDSINLRQKRRDLIESQAWTHIILQGQKYSQSGQVVYPTDVAEMWIASAKENGSTPILFPEHPQRGNPDEGWAVHNIHTTIAQRQRSCVAPVGLTWDNVIKSKPGFVLHQNDGNHATLTGRLLTAYVFYETITGNAADMLPYIESIGVPQQTQLALRQYASETIASHPPCVFGD